MHNHGIEAQLMALENAGIISSVNFNDAKKVLEDYWSDKVAVVWEIDDILWKAQEDGKLVTEEEAKDVLNRMLNKHDATIGINWDTIGFYIEDYPDDPNPTVDEED